MPISLCYAVGWILFLTSWLWGGEEPQRMVVKQEGKEIVFFLLGGKQYREVRTEDVEAIPFQIPVSFSAKLAQSGGNRILFHEPSLLLVSFRLAPGVVLDASPGSNLRIYGMKVKDGESFFQIEAISRLPSDVEVFQERLIQMEREGRGSLEIFRLVWWLEKSKSLMRGITQAEYDAFDRAAEQGYRLALTREEAGLFPVTKESLCARLQGYKTLCEELSESAPTEQAAWHHEVLRHLLDRHSRAIQILLSQGDLDTESERMLAAECHLLVGRMYLRYLQDEVSAHRLFLQGITLAPQHPELTKELHAQGYVFHQGRWIDKQEAKRLPETAKPSSVAPSSVEHATEQQKGKKISAALDPELRAGRQVAKKRLAIDQLLVLKEWEEIAESLAPPKGKEEKLLPEDVARYALFEAASLPEEEAVRIIEAGLRSPSARVRCDAADILLAMRASQAKGLLLPLIEKDPEPEVQRHILAAIAHLPNPSEAIPLLLEIMERSPRKEIKTLIGEILHEVTGENFGADTFGWKAWWLKKEKALPK